MKTQIMPIADPMLAEIVHRLVEAFGPEQIYLFGSHARDEAGPDSDYDLMVVVPQATEPGYRLAQQAHSLLWGLGVAADILVWTREQFDSRHHVIARFPPPSSLKGSCSMAPDPARAAEVQAWFCNR